MNVKTVGVMSPGDMGNAVASMIAASGRRVVVALDERSPRTRDLARAAGLEDVGSVERLVEAADVVLSVLVPSEAEASARRVASALRATGSSVVYADCNAISPGTTKRVGQIIESAGSSFVDASIIGPPPRKAGTTKIYISGPRAGELEELSDCGLVMKPMGGQIGDASGIKMCYAALTKGLTALSTELLVTSERLGVAEALKAELEGSQQELMPWIDRFVNSMPSKAHRWVGEMEEIAATFEEVGLTPRTLLGAADMYRFVAATELGKETPETRDASRPLWQTVAELARESTPPIKATAGR
ncbi:MAG: DUF1932 domain-containing protein [Chloroflexota bacterium]